MNIKTAEEIRNEVKKQYNKNPKGWQVLSGKDASGYHNTIILHYDKMWMIKEEFINPYKPVGYGVKAINIDDNFKPFLKNPYSFGYRPLTMNQAISIFDKGIPKELGRILKSEPVRQDKISPITMIGPIITPKKINFVSREQKNLNMKLTKELDKMIIKKYPDLMTPYV